MRLRITRQLPPRFNGFETQPYQVNHVYEIGRALGDLLIGTGLRPRSSLRQDRRPATEPSAPAQPTPHPERDEGLRAYIGVNVTV